MNIISSNTVTKMTFILIVVCLLAGVCLANCRSYAIGLTLGITASFINARYLLMKVRQLSELTTGQRKRYNLGFGGRLCVTLVVTFIGIKLEQVSLVATIIGLVSMQIITIIVSMMAEWEQDA